MKIRIKYFQELVIVLGVIILAFNYLQPEKLIIKSDGKGYYEYLPAIFIYHDLHWNYLDTLNTKGYYKHSEYKVGAIIEFRNKKINKYFIGTAFLMSPFFMMGHIWAKITDQPQDGYSKPYQDFMWIAALFYLWLGLLYVRRLLNRLNIKAIVIFIVQILLVFATPCLHYVTYEPTFSHVYSFAVITALSYYFLLFVERQENKYLYIVFVLCALTILIRPFNILIILIFPVIFSGLHQLCAFIKNLLVKKKTALIKATLFTVFVLFLQCLVWYIETGKFIIDSYYKETFDFSNPEIINVLFSYRKGLFIYSPVLFIGSVLALVYGIIHKKYFAIFSLLIPFLIFTYILSSWWSWWYGMSYGQRSYIDILVLFAIIMAYGLNKLPVKLFYVILPIFLVTIPVTVIQCFQYKTYILHWDMMEKESFWEVFLKTEDRYRGVLWQQEKSYSQNQIVYQYMIEDGLQIPKNTSYSLLDIINLSAVIPENFDMVEFQCDINDQNSDSKIILSLKSNIDSSVYWNQIFTYHQTRGAGVKKKAKFQFSLTKKQINQAENLFMVVTADNKNVQLRNGVITMIAFNEDGASVYTKKIKEEVLKIKLDTSVMNTIKIESLKTGEPVNKLIQKKAKKIFQFKERKRRLVIKMRSTPEWLRSLETKANDQGVSLDEMIERDVEYVLNND